MGGGLKRSRRMDRSDGTARRLSSTFGVRLAGAALCTAGLAFVGYGTVGSQWSLFSAKNTTVTVTDPGCDGTSTNCLNESFEGHDLADEQVACSPDDPSAHPDQDQWVFVIPDQGGNKPVFVVGTFTATFAGFASPVLGAVGTGGNGSDKFATIYVPPGSILEEASAHANDASSSPLVGLFFNVTHGCAATTTTSSSGTTATVSTTKNTTTTTTKTAPGTTVTTTVTGPTTTTTAPGTTTTTTAPGTTNTATKTVTVSTATTVTVPTTVTDGTTQTNTATTTVSKTATTTVTLPGTTVTVTSTVPTTNTVTTTVTSNHTATTTVTAPTTVTEATTKTNTTTATGTVTATTTKTVTTGTGAASTSSSSTSSSTPTSGVQAATTTPSTGSGSDIAFGTGLVLLVTGGGLIAGATRITRRKKS